MRQEVLFALSGVFLCVAAFLAFQAVRTWRELRANNSEIAKKYQNLRKKRKEVSEAMRQLERALAQLETGTEDQILAGLQTLSVLNNPALRVKAIGRLTELAQSDNPLIARQAGVTIKRLSADEGEPVVDRKAYAAH